LLKLFSFDTTANTLANTMFVLAKDPERMKILQAEIDEVCPEEVDFVKKFK